MRWLCRIFGHLPIRVDQWSDGEFVYFNKGCRRCGMKFTRGRWR